jgi:SAM-dependent methyltransferase
VTGAADRWSRRLADWAVPDEILAAAPETPWGFDVGLFSRVADRALADRGATFQRSAEALPEGGSVLDVGCGAGAASLRLAPPAALLVGVDESGDMLAEFARRAAERGADHIEVEGRWPDVADTVPVADVVVCQNVLYNVADLDPFVRQLHRHARRRVVVELTERHPLAWMNPYWSELHDVSRPDGPTADDALALAREAGLDAHAEQWHKPAIWEHEGDELVAFVRRRLCLPTSRDDAVRAAIERHPPPANRGVVTLWWDV